MKLSSMMMLMLLTSMVFLAWGLLVADFEINYVQTNISATPSVNETFLQSFDNTKALNDSMSDVRKGFDKIATSEGFFEGLVNVGFVIPKALIAIPKVLFIQLQLAITTLTDVLKLIAIDGTFIVIGLVGLFMFVLFKLVEFFGKHPV